MKSEEMEIQSLQNGSSEGDIQTKIILKEECAARLWPLALPT